MSRRILLNGNKVVDLADCLKKDPRSFYEGTLYLESGTDYYAEFECLPNGLVIYLVDEPDKNRFYSKDTCKNGKYKIPKVLFEAYKLDRTRSSALYQISEREFYLNGRLSAKEREIFQIPQAQKSKIYAPVDDFELGKAVFVKNVSSNRVLLGRSYRKKTIKIGFHFNDRIYVSLREEEDPKDCVSLQELKRMFGSNLGDFAGKSVCFSTIADQNGYVNIPKKFFDFAKIDPANCELLYDKWKHTYYLNSQCVYSELSGKPFSPAKEVIQEVVVQEDGFDVLKGLLHEMTSMYGNVEKMMENYEIMRQEHLEMKRLLKEHHISGNFMSVKDLDIRN